MIIIKLNGGLGNQLFQYAFGRMASILNNNILKFDISSFKPGSKREYSLKYFNIKGEIANKLEINNLIKYKNCFLFKLLNNSLSTNRKKYVDFQWSSFNKNIFKVNKNVYLEGYWQSENFFYEIRSKIIKEITLKNNYDNLDSDMKSKISNTDSISIHIRRGDYNDKKTNKIHGLCTPYYYYRAIEIMKKKIHNPYFFVFTDDLNWVRKNIRINYPHIFISGSKYHDYEEFMYLNKCKHHIIANSTFSWWGAWLCKNEKKQIIAPVNWLRDDKINTQDVIPGSWQKINN